MRAGEDVEGGVEAGEAHCVLPGSSVSVGEEQMNAKGLWSWFQRKEVTTDLIALLLRVCLSGTLPGPEDEMPGRYVFSPVLRCTFS